MTTKKEKIENTKKYISDHESVGEKFKECAKLLNACIKILESYDRSMTHVGTSEVWGKLATAACYLDRELHYADGILKKFEAEKEETE
jgi:hypothetical protein